MRSWKPWKSILRECSGGGVCQGPAAGHRGDRLVFSGAIIETGTDSSRLAQTRAKTEQCSAG